MKQQKLHKLAAMKTRTMGAVAAALLLIGSLFVVQADGKQRGINLKPHGKPIKDTGNGGRLDRYWLDEVEYVGNSKQANVLEPKDDQLQFRQWQKKVNCISCHGAEKKKDDWNLFPLHDNGKLSEKKWLKKTDCFSCHKPEKGKGMLLWPRLHKFNLPKKDPRIAEAQPTSPH
jgi:hypothetical protein